MGWERGSTCLGLGLAGFTWVAPMMGIIIPPWMLPLLLSLWIILILVWPVSAALARLVPDKRKRLVAHIRVWSVLGLFITLGAYRFSPSDPSLPQLALYFNSQPLEGQRIPIKMETERVSPPVYHISLKYIEIREEGRKVEAHVSTPRWRLSEKDIECLSGCGDGELEPSDAAQYPTVFRGPAFSVDAGGKSFFPHILFRKHGHPATEIRTELELRYGPPDPIHATFTMLPYE